MHALLLALALAPAPAAPPAAAIVVQLRATPARVAPPAAGATLERLRAAGLSRPRRFDEGLPPGPAPAGLDPARLWRLEASDSGAARFALALLAGDPAVAWAEIDPPREPALLSLHAPPAGAPPASAFPDDPLHRDGRQWALRNLGPQGPGGGRAGADVGAAAAWARTTGDDRLLLAVADTGIDPAHPDLESPLPGGEPRIAPGWNVTADPAGTVIDRFGHGTPVAGAMAALTHNGATFDSLGIAGLCGGDGSTSRGCRILPIKIAPGHSGGATAFDIARGILAATRAGARAVNLSFAGLGPSRLERLALAHAMARGTIVVAAAGNWGGRNGGRDPVYPAAYAAEGLCIQAGASDRHDRRAFFSSFGPGLDLVAPGHEVWTTYMTYPSHAGASYPGYVMGSGTSFAAPHVTAAVGLLAAARPELRDADFQQLLRGAAADLGPPGADAETGWGRLDAARALEAVHPGIGIWHDEVAADRFEPRETDTLAFGEPGPGTAGGAPRLATRIEASVTVALPDSFLDSVRVWPRVAGTSTLASAFRARWAVSAARVERGARSFTLSGSLFRAAAAGDAEPWVPLPPDQARFGFTVIGRVDRPPALRLEPLPSAPAAGSDTLRLRWDCEDPDRVTSFEAWLEARGATLLARLPGEAREALLVVPCRGRGPGARLRLVALDDHGHRDRAEVLLPLPWAEEPCPETAPALAASPNPFRGALRIDAPGAARVEILDLAGRSIRTLPPRAVWDGRDRRGRPAPPGLYLLRARGAGGAGLVRVVKLE